VKNISYEASHYAHFSPCCNLGPNIINFRTQTPVVCVKWLSWWLWSYQ